jgi:hypothetical protein
VSAFDSDGIEEVHAIPRVLGGGYGVLVLLFGSALSTLRDWRLESHSYLDATSANKKFCTSGTYRRA